jgi:hypothetical protein
MSRHPVRSAITALTALPFVFALASAQQAGSGSAPAHNTLTAAERAAGWKLLFDGKTTAGWRGYQMKDMPPAWKVVDGVLTKEEATEDIVTTDSFGDFELSLEWKLNARGNSGLFYRATEEYNRVYWSAPEYQLLDDSLARDGRQRITAAGAAHSLYAAPAGVVKRAGEWNHTRVVAKGAHVEYWLNGQKLFEFEMWSADWDARVKASKFEPWANFGKAKSGLIAIQGDHNGLLELRNLRIRTLN